MLLIRPFGAAASAVGVATIVVYFAVLASESDGNPVDVALLWVGAIFVAPALALVGAVSRSRRIARATLLSASVIFGVLGFLAIFSIGLLLLVASALAAVDFVRATADG